MIILRNAKLEDQKDFSKLVMLSAEKYFPFIFSKKIPLILEKLFVKDNSFFCHNLTTFAEIDNKIVGCMLTFSFADKKKYETKTAISMVLCMGFSFFRYMKRILTCTSIIGEFGQDEFYISNLATYPEYRNKGAATALLKKAEEMAIANNAKKVVLDVETDKTDAINLYKNNGFEIEKSITLPYKQFCFYGV
ncbi:MAG: hypothetical protein A2Y34_16515 [Spirochaetes bacterium GWC1_27_15]|nr:MAG: hypothetical protein A2Z98_08145 [Spirochaetes bacterium GWB1_27_13]OHD22580.1 MAG: hypothetical protein A2Y34_16515 [Spirochaetes bacterium GWC1_27_15]